MGINIDNLMEVTSSEIFRMDKYHPEGIFSEVIFGPVRNYCCSCGEISGVSSKGRRCPKCNVLCDRSDLRYTTFGKITLKLPILKPSLKKKLLSICRSREYIIDPVKLSMAPDRPSYLCEDRGIPVLKDEPCGTKHSKIKITGIFSLYLALCEMAAIDSKYDKYLNYFTDTVLVTPPGTRDIVKIDGKEIEKEINVEYRSLIWYNNSISFDLNIDELIESGKIYDYDFYDYDLCVGTLQYRTDYIFQLVKSQISGKSGLIRSSFFSKTIDFSSRAVITVNPALKAYEVNLPEATLKKLLMVDFLRYLSENSIIDKENYVKIIDWSDSLFDDKMNEHFYEFLSEFLCPQNSDRLRRLVLVNRQPTLWRYGIFGMEISGMSHGNTIELSPLAIEQFNADFDGDTCAVYKFHDTDAQKQIEKKNFGLSCIKYDHTGEFLNRIRLEALYMFNVMTSCQIDNSLDEIKVRNLNELEINIDIPFETPVRIGNMTYSYGIALVNKLCKFNTVIIKEKVDNNKLTSIIFDNSVSYYDFHSRLHDLMKHLFILSTIHRKEYLTIPFTPNLINREEITNNLPDNPYFGSIILEMLMDYKMSSMDKDDKLFKLTGTKLNRMQLSRIGIAVGYIADHRNKVLPKPVKSSLFVGLTEDEFFETSFGARKGLVDKVNKTPDSGYLERTMTINLSNIEIVEDDCKTNRYFEIEIMSKKHASSLIGRWMKSGNSEILIDKNVAESLYPGMKIMLRSPITCKTENMKICKRCFGEYEIPSNRVGILAAKYISERFTQLVLRTFHTSGSANIQIPKDVIKFCYENISDIEYDNGISIWQFSVDIPDEIIEKIKDFPGFIEAKGNVLKFSDIDYETDNEDITRDINIFSKALSKEGEALDTVYPDLMKIIMKNSNMFSVWLEIVLCNMYTDSNGVPIRYCDNIDKICKLSIKTLHTIISPLLGLIYEPNVRTIMNILDTRTLKNINPSSIFEELWIKY